MIDIKEKAMKRAKRFFSFNHSLSGPADVGYFNAEQRRELEKDFAAALLDFGEERLEEKK